LTVFLRFPREHWHRIRHTNLIERTFGETRRRTKVIGRLPGERSCLSLVWAVLDRASRGWRGVTQTPAGVRLLHDLRRDLRLPPHRQPDKEVTHPPVTAAA
jgi:putative transposase